MPFRMKLLAVPSVDSLELLQAFSFLLFVCFVLFFFQGRVSLCSPGCSGTYFFDLAGLEIRFLPGSASQILLVLKLFATTAQLFFFFFWLQGFNGSPEKNL